MKIKTNVIGILRGIEPDFFKALMPASFAAGLKAIEVTFNTHKAEQMISENRPKVPDGYYLGMGTIRNVTEARKAVEAGSMFLISPNLDLEVIRYAKKQGIPIISGALTPSEIYQAWSAGAEMVKVFPSSLYGPNYFKDLKGPFEQIPLMAVGGVNHDNVDAFFKAGAQAVGVSSALFGRAALSEKNIGDLTENVKTFINTAIKALER